MNWDRSGLFVPDRVVENPELQRRTASDAKHR